MAHLNYYSIIKSYVLIFVVLQVVIFSLNVATAAPNNECVKNTRACNGHIACCSGCCSDGKCADYSDSCIKETNPCTTTLCPPNKVCYLQHVTCVQAPCPPIPACKSIDYDYDYKA